MVVDAEYGTDLSRRMRNLTALSRDSMTDGDSSLVNYRGAMVAEIDNLVHWLLKRSEENGRVDLVKILPQYTYDSTVCV
jgi:hypothetical protein